MDERSRVIWLQRLKAFAALAAIFAVIVGLQILFESPAPGQQESQPTPFDTIEDAERAVGFEIPYAADSNEWQRVSVASQQVKKSDPYLTVFVQYAAASSDDRLFLRVVHDPDGAVAMPDDASKFTSGEIAGVPAVWSDRPGQREAVGYFEVWWRLGDKLLHVQVHGAPDFGSRAKPPVSRLEDVLLFLASVK